MHKKSSMRSVQAKLPLHGLESQLLISEAQNILEIKSQPFFFTQSLVEKMSSSIAFFP